MTSAPPKAPTTTRGLAAAAVVFAALAFAPAAQAATIIDPVGDFIPSYAGQQNADLDVVTASASFLGSSYQFSTTYAGTIGTTPGSVYVWGVDRGQGTARFGAIATGVLFDSVVVFTPGVSTLVRDLIAGITTVLPTSATQVAGAALTIDVAASLLPSLGLAADRYTANHWPRSGNGNNNQISDFAPDNSNLAVAVAEPAAIGIFAAGILGMLWLGRRRTPDGAAA